MIAVFELIALVGFYSEEGNTGEQSRNDIALAQNGVSWSVLMIL